MKKKRLDRDLKWGFHYFPYYQFKLDCGGYKGFASLISMTDGDCCYWEMPKAGKIPVCGKGMLWLQLVPEGSSRLITVMYQTADKVENDISNSCSAVAWYVDVIEALEYDTDGVAVYTDKYLDVIFTPQGDVRIDDRDELELALTSGDITQLQYTSAIEECDLIIKELCSDISRTEKWCSDILNEVMSLIRRGEKPMKTKYHE